jgi:O-antigen biosynthesis protein
MFRNRIMLKPGPSTAFRAPMNGRNSLRSGLRPEVRGKHLFIGGDKFHVRGVTYGTFAPDSIGDQFPSPPIIDHDFGLMRAHGVNSVRTYTVPPRWLLDRAHRHGLRVMVGLPWEQHIAFLERSARARSIENSVRAGVRACAGHPAVLCYAIGNEIPAAMVRWHGARQVERFLERLYRAVKDEDPDGLVTYVNYPTTEYLNLPFLDLIGFNVYLESREKLAGYLARLHNQAGDRPLVLAELGLDSLRNGEDAQAQVLDWQVRTAFATGCAGMFVFAWTDEWYRGGHEIDDWDFGLTDRERRPKPALGAVGRAFADGPFPAQRSWPRISVVVCCHNGESTLRDCLEGLQELDYPEYEVIVVDDGSRDASATIAAEYPFRLISTENRGLSNARNLGLAAATGEIVAYTDCDARPDPHWLTCLATSFLHSTHAAIGGPNIPPAGDGLIADCVANSPGGPVHVLISDTEAEHIPGVNMAFRKECLEAIGGFDPQYRTAGDDVDVCWRLQQQGWTLGFSPSAVVWHHCRDSVRTYWKQQKGYGKAEALLERKWPEKYNGTGHLRWSGRLYGKGLLQSLDIRRGRIYQGVWGSALFQSVYRPAPGVLSSLPMMPEWYILIVLLSAISVLGVLWMPLLSALPLLGLALLASVIQAVRGAAQASFTSSMHLRSTRMKLYSLTGLLYLLQPLARLWGRVEHGLTPWRRWRTAELALPRPHTLTVWSERWQAPEQRVEALEAELRAVGAVVRRGGDYDDWDLETRSGTLGTVRLLTAVEEHGAGKQLFRVRVRLRLCRGWGLAAGLLAMLSLAAGLSQAWSAAALLGVPAAWILLRCLRDCAAATAAVHQGIARLNSEEQLAWQSTASASSASEAPGEDVSIEEDTPLSEPQPWDVDLEPVDIGSRV